MLPHENLLIDLLSQPSITPDDQGCMAIINEFFKTPPRYFNQGDTHNALWTFGQGKKHLLFVGHTDVVPPGPLENWHNPPFSPKLSDIIYARGIVDMKGAIWAFCSALKSLIPQLSNQVSILLTSDEEGDGKHGIKAIIPQLIEEGFHCDFAMTGEPTSREQVGDYYKHKRRGSYTLELHIIGKQGHSAYPLDAWNPIQSLTAVLSIIETFQTQLQKDHTLSLFSINTPTDTSNIIPKSIKLGLNIRYFNPQIIQELKTALMPVVTHIIERPGALPYQSNPKLLKQALIQSIENITKHTPAASIQGGTSDARFLSAISDEIIEFGLSSLTAHHINEQASQKDLLCLHQIYTDFLFNLMCK